MHEDIAVTLISLKNRDLQLRERLARTGQLNKGYHPEMEALHRENTAVLHEVIDRIGYPTTTKVGAEASAAAWLVVQHSIGAPDFMRRWRGLLAKAVERGEAKATRLAYLTDRIAVFEGKPQLYGTQFDWDAEGRLSPNTYDDLAAVDRRRGVLGWNTISEQTEIMRKRAAAEGLSPPEDAVGRRRAYEEWRRSVGWMDV